MQIVPLQQQIQTLEDTKRRTSEETVDRKRKYEKLFTECKRVKSALEGCEQASQSTSAPTSHHCPSLDPSQSQPVNVTVAYLEAESRFHPKGRFQVLGWEAFSRRHVFSPYRTKARVNIEGVTRVETSEVIEFASRARPDDTFEFAHGTFRVHPLLGIEYLVDFSKKQSSTKPAVYHRVGVLRPFSSALQVATRYGSHALYLNVLQLYCKPRDRLTLAPPNVVQCRYEVDVNDPTTMQTLYMVMPLAGRLEVLVGFLKMLAKAVPLPGGAPVHLTVAYFQPPGDSADQHQAGAANVSALLEGYAARGLQYHVLPMEGEFSRGGGLEAGAKSVTPTDSDANPLLFFVDVDMTFDSSFLFRCRVTPRPGERVYYPTVFSLYQDHVSITREMQNAGLWREAGFGMVCVHRGDFLSLGGFDKTIRGWGKEDVDLFDRMIRRFDVVRAVDDGIMHEWHDKYCDPALPLKQLIMCNGAKANMEGDKMVLGAKLARARHVISQLNSTNG